MISRPLSLSWGIVSAFIFSVICIPTVHAGGEEFSGVPTPTQLYEIAAELESLPVSSGAGLLSPISEKPTASAPAPSSSAIARSRRANVSADGLSDLMGADGLKVSVSGSLTTRPSTFTLDLFDDVSVRIVKLDMTENELGHTIWRGAVVGGGEAMFAINGDQVTGVVRAGTRSFRIQPERGAHRVIEFDAAGMPRNRNDAIVPNLPTAPQPQNVKAPAQSPAQSPANEFETAATTPATINLLVVYTAAAAADVEDINAAISLAVAYTNTALSNSQADVQVTLAGTGTVNIQEAGVEMGTILSDFQESNGDFARIQTLRANLRADLVQVWVGENGSPESCGIGYVLSDADQPNLNLASLAPFGVSAVTTDFGGGCLTDTIAHELGHNLGSEHDRFQTEDDVAGPEGYNYGFIDLGFFRTIMAYTDQCESESQSCPLIQHFSNPNVNFNGRPTGAGDSTPEAANAARKINEIAQVISQLDAHLTPDALVHMGLVSSSLQTESGSFLRVHNTSTQSGTATISLLTEQGNVWGEWTSANVAPDSELQFAVTSIETDAMSGMSTPPYYSVRIQAGFQGYTQHVLYRPADGTLTNLSTCSAGVKADQTVLSGVHSSLIAAGFPSSVVINNTGSTMTSASLGIHDAATGTKLGTYVSPSIPANGQVVIPMTTMEAFIGVVPTSTMYHYVIKVEGQFDGFLQHLVNNIQAGVITDMTTVCALDASVTTAAVAPLRLGAVFSTGQTSSQSFLRFHNNSSNAGTITVTVRNLATGSMLGQWTSPSVAPNGESQFGIGTLENELGISMNKPEYYSLSISATTGGYIQHVLYRPADGTLTNLSTCPTGVTAAPRSLSGVHTSLLGTGFPSTIVINNTGSVSTTATLTVYDASNGSALEGTYTSASIAPNGHLAVLVSEIESALGFTPGTGQFHYVIEANSGFTGYLQHLVNNVQAGVITDMTTTCQLPS